MTFKTYLVEKDGQRNLSLNKLLKPRRPDIALVKSVELDDYTIRELENGTIDLGVLPWHVGIRQKGGGLSTDFLFPEGESIANWIEMRRGMFLRKCKSNPSPRHSITSSHGSNRTR